MVEVLRSSDIGVGLAAPQIGISKKIFVASANMPDAKNKEKEPILVCINPKILSKKPLTKKDKAKKKKDKKLEGCLSILVKNILCKF